MYQVQLIFAKYPDHCSDIPAKYSGWIHLWIVALYCSTKVEYMASEIISQIFCLNILSKCSDDRILPVNPLFFCNNLFNIPGSPRGSRIYVNNFRPIRVNKLVVVWLATWSLYLMKGRGKYSRTLCENRLSYFHDKKVEILNLLKLSQTRLGMPGMVLVD